MPRSNTAKLKKNPTDPRKPGAKVYLIDGNLAGEIEAQPTGRKAEKVRRPKKRAKLSVIESRPKQRRAKPKLGKAKKARAKTKQLRTASKPAARIRPAAKSLPFAIPAGQWRKAYQLMLQTRLTDEKVMVLCKQSRASFQISSAGHEAVQAAAGHVFRPGKDWFFPYYRDMALMSALGMTPRELFLNAMNKEEDPNSHGRQMPSHWSWPKMRVACQSSPVGSQFPQAVGCALAAKRKGLREVVYVSGGDGACSQGDFHEALNWAAREKLAVVFVVQNNNYAISVNISEQLAGGSAAKIASGYEGLAAVSVDGTDYEQSYRALKQAHTRALKGEGPSLIEALVPRLRSHSISDNQAPYRGAAELERDLKRCPLPKTRRYLLRNGIATNSALKAMEASLKAEVDEAADWAYSRPNPDPASVMQFSFTEPEAMLSVPESELGGDEVFMAEALNHALDEEMLRNPDMCIFGQDVGGSKGGVFLITAGLVGKYGPKRVFNAQLAENSIVAAAIGATLRGLKPVIEIQFADFIWSAMNQIRNELAMLHYRSCGEFTAPVVIRAPVGGYTGSGCYHSQNIEATFAHFPGMYILYPSNATDAKGLLKSAIRASSPVLFLEHKGLYRQPCAKGPEGDADTLTPIGRAKVVRQGTDATVVTWGAPLHKAISAADHLATDGLSVEVIDLRSIVPIDWETVYNSVRKTNRLLIAHEDARFMGFGAEIAAQVTDTCFEHLDAPIRRVAMKDVAALPFQAGLEKAILPQDSDILEGLGELLAY